MELNEKDRTFIAELVTAPEKNITLYSILRTGGEKPYYGCILYPSRQVAVTQQYATLQEASDAASREAQKHGSHLWSTLFIASDYFHGVLTTLQLTPMSLPRV